PWPPSWTPARTWCGGFARACPGPPSSSGFPISNGPRKALPDAPGSLDRLAYPRRGPLNRQGGDRVQDGEVGGRRGPREDPLESGRLRVERSGAPREFRLSGELDLATVDGA